MIEKEGDRLRKNSVIEASTENRIARQEARQIKMSKKERTRRLKRIILAAALGTSLTATAAPKLIQNIVDTTTISSMSHDFKRDVISPNTRRTDDGKHYFYDYEKIAATMEDMENFDEAVYLLNSNIGDYQTGQVLARTKAYAECAEDGSFTAYKKENGYESTEEFQKKMREEILEDLEQSKNSDDINHMLSENEQQTENIQRMGER